MVAVIASNDPFVMSAWGKVNEVKGDDLVFSLILRISNAVANQHSCSCPTPTRSSPAALAGPMALAPVAMPSSSTTAR